MTPTARGWFAGAALTASIAAGGALTAAFAQPTRAARPNDPKQTAVLFMCPHAAAKSVLASAYFQRLARQRGLNVRVWSAGTDPDPVIAPAVAAHLGRNGYPVPTAAPRKVTEQDLASADLVISIGCDLSGLPQPRGALRQWDEVPALSENFARADEAIRKRVVELVDELVLAKRR